VAKRKIRIFLRPFADGGKWLGLDHVRAVGSYTSQLFTRLVSRPRPIVRFESFDQAVSRYSLTEEDIRARTRAFALTAATYGVCALAMLGYAMYAFAYHNYVTAISASSLTFMLLSFTFREHFWHIQMKHKVLGLSFGQWYLYTFKGSME
jgi:hypothetical protein